MSERRRTALRHEALETAANILESAQACPWDELTPAWAAQQRLPESLLQQLPDNRLAVRVETDPGRPLLKRVTVEIGWRLDDGLEARPVFLTSLFSARSASLKGGQP